MDLQQTFSAVSSARLDNRVRAFAADIDLPGPLREQAENANRECITLWLAMGPSDGKKIVGPGGRRLVALLRSK